MPRGTEPPRRSIVSTHRFRFGESALGAASAIHRVARPSGTVRSRVGRDRGRFPRLPPATGPPGKRDPVSRKRRHRCGTPDIVPRRFCARRRRASGSPPRPTAWGEPKGPYRPPIPLPTHQGPRTKRIRSESTASSHSHVSILARPNGPDKPRRSVQEANRPSMANPATVGVDVR